jgi:hypothetical protein
MPRELIQTVTTKLYDNQGRHVADRVDNYFVDKKTGVQHQAQQPSKPRPAPQTPPATPRPERPAAIRTMAAARQAVLKVGMAGAPPAPDTLGEALRWRKEHWGY